MFVRIDEVLSRDEVSRVRALLDAGTYDDGRKTAGWAASPVKKNLQLEPGNKSGTDARALVTERLQKHTGFEMAARPKAMRPLTFARYDPGMEYGWHVDDALMGGPPALRTDLAFTIFLSEPGDYDGGELTVRTPAGEHAYKLPAGSMLLYPADTLHRVAPVNRGVRYVAISWVQSLVRDHAQRELLYSLDLARREAFEALGAGPVTDRLHRVLGNLVRMWVEP